MKRNILKSFLITFFLSFNLNPRMINAEYSYNYFYNSKAIEKFANKDYEGALEEINKSIKLGPSPDEFYYKNSYLLRAETYRALEEYESALKDINVFIEYDPKIEKAYEIRQEIKYDMKDFTGAIEDANIMLILNPNSGDAYAKRGLSLLALGQKEKACTDLRKALGILGGSDYGIVVWGLIEVRCEGKKLFGN